MTRHSMKTCRPFGASSTLARMAIAALVAMIPAAFASAACTVSASATLSFGAVTALASTPDQIANTGTSFFVNCTADVTNAPSLYTTSTLTLVSGSNSLPFSLSLSPSMSPVLPTTSPGTALSITANGTNQTVTLYARILSASFRSLPAGTYTASIFLTVDY